MTSTQKIITQAANIVKNEIKNVKYQMSWPPETDELNMPNFINPPNLDSFLLTLLNEGEPETNRASRLKSSFGQDLTYAGILFFFLFFVFIRLLILQGSERKTTCWYFI